tara:strand:- start:714 stop:1088 length:375 start_codon:yes stop_codon:yes gene_type:complete
MKKNKKKRQKNKENKVIPFKRDLKLVENQNPENLKEKEIDRVNTHLKKNFEALEKFVDEASLSSSDTWYRIMFFAKQRAIHVLSYANYKINDQLSTEEVTGNFVEFTNKQFPELKKSETDKLLH